MSDPGERIVAQGVEYIGEVTRCWSRWNTGAWTWEDTRTVWSTSPTGTRYASIWHVGSGSGFGPPSRVKMVDVAPMLERVGGSAPTTDPVAPQQESNMDRERSTMSHE